MADNELSMKDPTTFAIVPKEEFPVDDANDYRLVRDWIDEQLDRSNICPVGVHFAGCRASRVDIIIGKNHILFEEHFSNDIDIPSFFPMRLEGTCDVLEVSGKSLVVCRDDEGSTEYSKEF